MCAVEKYVNVHNIFQCFIVDVKGKSVQSSIPGNLMVRLEMTLHVETVLLKMVSRGVEIPVSIYRVSKHFWQ